MDVLPGIVFIVIGAVIWSLSGFFARGGEQTRVRSFGGSPGDRSAKNWRSYNSAITRVVAAFFVICGVLVLAGVLEFDPEP